MADSTPTSTTLAEYIFTRLHQLGLRSIFGVPGDYNLRLLDYVEPSGLNWVGNCNELNSGYAADGYARINGIGALITTFGVGELSAVNAIAGSYTELVPVVHIVGTPPREVQDARALVHHTLCDGEFGRFAKMYEQVTAAQVELRDLNTCLQQIDWILGECLRRSRPVYVRLPDDMAVAQVDPSRLRSSPIEIFPPTLPQALVEKQRQVLGLVLERMKNSERPAILIDGESRAFGILDDIDTLVKTSGWHTWTTGFGKGLVNETYPNVLGVFQGAGQPAQKAYFDAADLVLNFGPHHSKTNTYFGSGLPKPSVTISFCENGVKIGDQFHQDLPARFFVPELVKSFDQVKPSSKQPKIASELVFNGEPEFETTSKQSPSTSLHQRAMWPLFNPMIGSGDAVFCETGTAAFGGRCFQLPAQTHFFTSVTWLSIGFMLPATMGAAVAQRDRRSSTLQSGINGENKTADLARTVLFIGDGSLQTTVQEISTIIAQKLNVTIVVVNNDGYTIERCIHGRAQKYNDIVEWDYLKAPQLFSRHGLNNPEYPVQTNSARTFGELEELVAGDLADRKPGFRMVEVFVEREDAPMYLRQLLDAQIQRSKA